MLDSVEQWGWWIVDSEIAKMKRCQAEELEGIPYVAGAALTEATKTQARRPSAVLQSSAQYQHSLSGTSYWQLGPTVGAVAVHQRRTVSAHMKLVVVAGVGMMDVDAAVGGARRHVPEDVHHGQLGFHPVARSLPRP